MTIAKIATDEIEDHIDPLLEFRVGLRLKCRSARRCEITSEVPSLFALLTLVAAATSSAAPRYANVHIGSELVRVPFPNGFCLPTGDLAVTAKILDQADNRNVTHLRLVNCDPTKAATSDYLMMQTPIGALNLNKSRAEFLDWLGRGLPSGLAPISIDNRAISQAVSERLAEVVQQQVKVDAALSLRSRDDVCVYLGGQATATVAGEMFTQAISGCASVAGRRPFNLFAYRNSKDPSGYKALQPMLRDWALSIRPLP